MCFIWCITCPCFLKEHTVDDEMNDVDGEEENQQSTSSIDVPQDFSMHHSDCMQSSETHQSSDEPMNSPICTVLITQSKEQPMSSKQSFQFPEQQSQQVQKEVKPNTGRVSKSQKTIQEENALMKKAIHCLDSLQSTTRNASIIPEKEKDGLDKFGEYIVSELRNVSNPQALNWAKLQIQNIIISAQCAPPQSKPPHFFPGGTTVNPAFTSNRMQDYVAHA